MLLPADGLKLSAVVLFAVGILIANAYRVAMGVVEMMEIVAKVFEARLLHGLRQFGDAGLYFAAFFVLLSLVEAIAEKSASLCQVVESAAQIVAVSSLAEV